MVSVYTQVVYEGCINNYCSCKCAQFRLWFYCFLKRECGFCIRWSESWGGACCSLHIASPCLLDPLRYLCSYLAGERTVSLARRTFVHRGLFLLQPAHYAVCVLRGLSSHKSNAEQSCHGFSRHLQRMRRAECGQCAPTLVPLTLSPSFALCGVTWSRLVCLSTFLV